MGIIILIVVNIQKKSTMQDKTPRNEKGQRHGNWIWYLPDGTMALSVHYANDKLVCLFDEFHGGLEYKSFYAR